MQSIHVFSGLFVFTYMQYTASGEKNDHVFVLNILSYRIIFLFITCHNTILNCDQNMIQILDGGLN